MFENQKQLIAAMKEILVSFKNNDDINIIFEKYPDDSTGTNDLIEAIDACLSNGYLTGVNYTVGCQDDLVVNLSNPHVTSKGVQFISEN